MPILALGVSYRQAPVELLERLSFADDDLPKAYRSLRDLEAVRQAERGQAVARMDTKCR